MRNRNPPSKGHTDCQRTPAFHSPTGCNKSLRYKNWSRAPSPGSRPTRQEGLRRRTRALHRARHPRRRRFPHPLRGPNPVPHLPRPSRTGNRHPRRRPPVRLRRQSPTPETLHRRSRCQWIRHPGTKECRRNMFEEPRPPRWPRGQRGLSEGSATTCFREAYRFANHGSGFLPDTLGKRVLPSQQGDADDCEACRMARPHALCNRDVS